MSVLSTYVDVGIAPFSVGITFDGSFVLPATKDYIDKQIALDVFNKMLAYLLFGGVFTECVLPQDVYIGQMSLDGYFMSQSETAFGTYSSFVKSIRMKVGSPLSNIQLIRPEKISIDEFSNAIYSGKAILSKIKKLTPSILISGITQYVKHQWSEALISSWTSIEQLLEYIWEVEIIKKLNQKGDPIAGRKRFLQDNRSWTSSTKIELFYQISIIDADTYRFLNQARKARNDFVHTGNKPPRETVKGTLRALCYLVSLIQSEYKDKNQLDDIIDMIENYVYPKLIPSKRVFTKDEVSHWMAMPPVPGFPGWGDEEYEIIEELQLKPLDQTERD